MIAALSTIGEQEEQRRTRSLSQLSLSNGAAGSRRKEGSVLFAPGDGAVDTEKEILAASERRRMTARCASCLLLLVNWASCLRVGC